jgi:hypothetical protein
MSDKPIVQRVSINPGYTMVILNAPPSYMEVIGEVPEKVSINKKLVPEADIVQVFAKNQAELNELFPKIKQTLRDDGATRVTYPKGTSKAETDIN